MGTAAAIGRVLGGRYRIASVLGTGSMSSVYRATQEDGPDVAVKLLKTKMSHPEAASARLFREARVISRLEHPGSVRLLDWGVEDGRPFVVLELMEGESLAELLARDQKMPAERAVPLVAYVCEVLQAAHDLGVVHRDLKPGNVMLMTSPQGDKVKVLDFGLARLMPQQSAEETQPRELTRPGSTLGTPSYMAPEQVRGSQVDGRADVYACGVLLYELVSGELPILGETAIDTMLKQATDPPRPILEVAPDLDPQLAGIIMRCLRKAPDGRFDTALQLKDALLSAGHRALSPDETRTFVRDGLKSADSDEHTSTALMPLTSWRKAIAGEPQGPASDALTMDGDEGATTVDADTRKSAKPKAKLPLTAPRPPRPARKLRASASAKAEERTVARPAGKGSGSQPPPPKRSPKRGRPDSATQLRSDESDLPTTRTKFASMGSKGKSVRLPMPSAPPVPHASKVGSREGDGESTNLISVTDDVSDLELTIPAHGGLFVPLADEHEMERTIPVSSLLPSEGATALHDMDEWASTRRLKKPNREALPAASSPAARPSAPASPPPSSTATPGATTPASSAPASPASSATAAPGATAPASTAAPPPPPGSHGASPDATRRMRSDPAPPLTAVAPPSVPASRQAMDGPALAEVLSGLPQDERRWLVGAAVAGIALALGLGIWLLL